MARRYRYSFTKKKAKKEAVCRSGGSVLFVVYNGCCPGVSFG